MRNSPWYERPIARPKLFFWALALVIALYTVHENYVSPEAKVLAVPISSKADVSRLLELSDNVVCPCSRNVQVGSFAKFNLRTVDDANEFNMSTNVCAAVSKLYMLFTFNKADTLRQFCGYYYSKAGMLPDACNACLASLDTTWPVSLADDRFTTVPPTYPFATPAGRVFLEFVLPVLAPPCIMLEKQQKLAVSNFLAFQLPQTLLRDYAMRQLVTQAGQVQLSEILSMSQRLRQELAMLRQTAVPLTSLSKNATRTNMAACDCALAATPECAGFRFMPAFVDLDANMTPSDSTDDSDSETVSPLWSCHVYASVLNMFPSELLNMNSSRLLQNIGIPLSCAAVFEPETSERGHGWWGSWADVINLPGVNFQNYAPFNADTAAASLIDINEDLYFAACSPHECTIINEGSFSSNTWLFLLLTAAAIHVEITLLSFVFRHAAQCIKCACCWAPPRYVSFGRAQRRDDHDDDRSVKGSVAESGATSPINDFVGLNLVDDEAPEIDSQPSPKKLYSQTSPRARADSNSSRNSAMSRASSVSSRVSLIDSELEEDLLSS